MARTNKYSINIDKLRICYVQPENLIHTLIEKANGKEYVDYEGFRLHFIDVDSDGEKVKQIAANVLLRGVEENEDYTLLGMFLFNASSKYEGKCFYKMANSALYNLDQTTLNGNKINLMCYIQSVTDILNLKFNNFTEVELAIDTTLNVTRTIRAFIRDYNNYDMFVNGNKIKDESVRIRGYCEIFDRSRKKLSRNPTLYLKQTVSKGIPLHMKAYDKSTELLEESPQKKEYTEAWDDFGDKKIYRLEITIPNDDYKQWLSFLQSGNSPYPKEWMFHDASQISLLMMDDYKLALLEFCARRMLFFRRKKGKSDITLLDILDGAKP